MNRITTNVDQKLLRTTKFPPEFNQKVDTTKINIPVIKNWAAGEVSKILGYEDDVVIGLLFDLLEGSKHPDIKSLQIQLTGFLEKDAALFCKELWNLCLSAQNSETGIPQQLVEAKKLELIQEKIEHEKAAEAARQRREDERTREREIESVRHREREHRDRGDRGGRGRGRGGGRDLDRRPPRDYSRSPPPRYRRGSDDYRRPIPPRETDSYVPSGNNGRRGERRRRSRSPLRRSPKSPSPRRASSPKVRRGAERNTSSERSRSRSSDRRYSKRDAESHRGERRRRDHSPYSRRRSPSPKRRRESSFSPGPRYRDEGLARSRKDRDGSEKAPPPRRRRSPSSSESIQDKRANAVKDHRSDNARSSRRRPSRSRSRSRHRSRNDARRRSVSRDGERERKRRLIESDQTPKPSRADQGESNAGAVEEVGVDS